MSTNPPNPLRPGSAAYLAVEAVRDHGPLAPVALALTVDKPADEIDSLVRYAVRLGLLRIDDAGRYALSDGVPLPPEVAVPAPAPAPAVTRKPLPVAKKSPVVTRAAPIVTPKPDAGVDMDAVYRRKNAEQVAALERELQPEPGKASIVVGGGRATVEVDVRELGATMHQIMPPPASKPASPPTAVPAPEPEAPAQIVRPHFVAAHCSDGTYVIEQGSCRIELNFDEAVELFEHMALTLRERS